MNDNDLKGKIACELIIEATETKGKRPTQLNFDELIDVVTGVVKKLSIPRVVVPKGTLCDKNENKLGMCNCCGDYNCHDYFCKG